MAATVLLSTTALGMENGTDDTNTQNVSYNMPESLDKRV